MQSLTGLFISFEGIDGSGKSSVVKLIEEKIIKEFPDVNLKLVREPGGTPVGELIREIILNPKNQMLPSTEAFLFAASRAELFQGVALQHLQNNGLLISDRFVDSSVVYQGLSQNVGEDTVVEINKHAINGLMPQYTFFLMLTPEIAMARINNNRKNQQDRLDAVDLAFRKRIYDSYLHLIEKHQERAVVIDASQELNQVVEAVWNKLSAIIKKHYYE